MRRRVLIVVSSYSPAMIADMHRARHLAWELPNYGWEVEILSPNASYQQPSCIDNDSSAFFAPDTPIHFVSLLGSRLFQFLGLGSIGWRALLPMLFKGYKLIKSSHFDLVFISTTQFSLFLLGPLWRWWLKIPYVLDFHDPCYRENARHPIWARPGLKHAINHWLTKHVESWATLSASGLVSVSPVYIDLLRKRYESQRPSWLALKRHAVISFAVLPHDLEEAVNGRVQKDKTGIQSFRIIYVGAGGPIMRRSFSLFCRALAQLRAQKPELVAKLRIELYGTMLGWREGDPCDLLEIAHKGGVGDLVREDPRRVSYRRSLEMLLDSDGALLLGVDDEGYMPSKLFSYALTGKPLLAVLHKASPAFTLLSNTPTLGHTLWFDQSGEMPVSDAVTTLQKYLNEATIGSTFERQSLLGPYLAPAMAQRHTTLFNICITHD